MDDLHEKNESLWWLVVSPTIWAVHFLASYITVAVWCAKVAGRDGELGAARAAVVVYTAVAIAGVCANGWYAWRRHKFGTATVPHDFDTPGDRHRFLGFASVLLSGLSLVGIIYAAMPVVFIGSCR